MPLTYSLPPPEVRKLAVLLNYAASPILTAEDLVGQLSDPTQSPQAAQLALRLQSPQRASLLLTKRLPAEYRATLPEGDPDEMLHRYVVLEYPDTATTMAAKAVLEKDPLVLFVKESTFSQFSIAPVDPLFATAPQIQNYQWGINNPLNLKSAWNSVRGTAYIAHLDNGIQNGNPNSNPATPLHEDLGQPWRPIFNFNIAGGNDVDEHPEQVSGRIVGHGTHTAGIIVAATTQASVRPGYPNPAKVGGAGVCWYCSLMIVKISRIVGGQIQVDDMVDLPNAINWAATSGAQAINLSLGGADHHCPTNTYDAYCFALSSATLKEVVIAAAAGNSDVHTGGDGHALGTTLDFPALSQYTIAVGAIQSYSGVRGNLWTEETPSAGFYGSSTGPGMETRGILAPGRDVLSTFYYGQVWNAGARCGSTTAQGTSKGPNYGVCTGTSMATPHITGIVGLLRTINPLLTRSQITSALLSSGDNAASPNTTRGYGVPNVSTAVNTVLATTNRLTPLFSHYSSVAWDHFYTVAPQMARASIAYGLLPYAVAPTTYAPYGTAIAEYPQFP
ncbi:MAG: S8 family serine peptidase, partial [Terriglobales bacterium]